MQESAAVISVRDLQTKQTFNIRAGENTTYIRTKDGVKVRIHPVVLQTMVKKGQKFDGHTVTGTRKMERV